LRGLVIVGHLNIMLRLLLVVTVIVQVSRATCFKRSSILILELLHLRSRNSKLLAAQQSLRRLTVVQKLAHHQIGCIVELANDILIENLFHHISCLFKEGLATRVVLLKEWPWSVSKKTQLECCSISTGVPNQST
jgi:hypothetical protein